jgi:hypothetical protein
MKSYLVLLIAAAVFNLPSGASAGAPLSPKARQMAQQSTRIQLSAPDVLTRSVLSKSPKAAAAEQANRRVSGVTPDLVVRTTVSIMPKILVQANPASRPWGDRFAVAAVK